MSKHNTLIGKSFYYDGKYIPHFGTRIDSFGPAHILPRPNNCSLEDITVVTCDSVNMVNLARTFRYAIP